MNRKMYWGIAALILFIGAFGFLLYKQHVDIQQLKKEAAEAEKLLEEKNMPIVENNDRPARPGYKLVPHDDHFHEVPVSAPDTWQGEPIPVAEEVQAKPTYTGPLTYHEELLKTDPVKALRLQAEERGHWSAKWIPPFPPDDTEAAEIARTQYLLIYYKSIEDTDNPEYKKANSASWDQTERLIDMPFSARACDLMMLIYPRMRAEDVKPVYEDVIRFDADGTPHADKIRRLPSDYFPLYLSDLK